MTILSLIFMGIVASLVSAAEGDYTWIKKIGEIVVYVVITGLILWFLSATGWPGLFMILAVCLIIPVFQSLD